MAVSSTPAPQHNAAVSTESTHPTHHKELTKTCHQCRQKNRKFAAACKNKRNNKPCPLSFCCNCLLNRYGEKVHEVELLKQWSCPKCRGKCNCSSCRKKSGNQPTGLLSHIAKASGYSSVSKFLEVTGSENFCYVKSRKEISDSLNKHSTSEKVSAGVSPGVLGKENVFDTQTSTPKDVVNKPHKLKQEVLRDLRNGNLNLKQVTVEKKHNGEKDGATIFKQTNLHAYEEKTRKLKRDKSFEMHDSALTESSPKKPRISYEKENKVHTYGKIHVIEEGEGPKIENSAKNRKKFGGKKCQNEMGKLHSKIIQNGVQHKMVAESQNNKIENLKFQSIALDADIVLSDETKVTNIGGVELPLKNFGNALQLLEFCSTFGKILNLKKGQANFILQEIINGGGRLLRREQYSLAAQFHIELLSLLQKESGTSCPTLTRTQGKNTWWCALKRYISGSHNALKSPCFECLDVEAGGYDALDSSTKLRLLNYLCDEVLDTVKIRNWIDDQNLRVAEKAKKAKERVLAAKEKEKGLRQKMQDEVAQAIIAKNGQPLSISEHDAIICQIKSEAAQTHSDLLESVGLVTKNKEKPDAVRTEPMLVDLDGLAYWRLNGYFDKSNILIQDIGTGDDMVAPDEKWYAFDAEKAKVIEKHISFRKRRPRAQTVAGISPSTNTTEA